MRITLIPHNININYVHMCENTYYYLDIYIYKRILFETI